MLAIAAGTDYVIFLFGRYQEARAKGADKESAYYEMFHRHSPCDPRVGPDHRRRHACLHFTRSPMFSSLGIPLFIGMLVVVSAAMTLGPSVVTVASRFRPPGTQTRFPRTFLATHRHRRRALAGADPGGHHRAVPGGSARLPGYHTDYNDRHYLPPDIPASGVSPPAERALPCSPLSPELLMLQSDHDLRNSADFLVIDRVAKAMFHTPGIGRVQTITPRSARPSSTARSRSCWACRAPRRPSTSRISTTG